MSSPLTSKGRDQARQAASQLKKMVTGSAEIHCSDALRAIQTARIIATHLGVELTIDPLLREQSLGKLEGQPVAMLSEQPVPPGTDIADIAWGGGESLRDVHRRLDQFMTRLRASQPTVDTIILVGHGDAMRVLTTWYAGKDYRAIDWDQPGLGYGQAAVLGNWPN